MSQESFREEVKKFVAPRENKIGPDICPGCMRRRHGIYFCGSVLSPFCDHFCEELWRKDRLRKESRTPWEESRHSFFVESATGIESRSLARETLLLTQKETAQYEPAY